MKTLALFDDGTASEILIGDFLEPQADLPLKSIPINIADKDVIHSAQNGFWAAYHILKSMGLIHGSLCFSYQFKEELRLHVVGNSAGLGFCLKLVREVLNRDRSQLPGFSIAATGVITDGTERAQVRRVDGITSKIEGAMSCLCRGDRVFYPYENDPEISPSVRERASRSGVELVSVSTVEQAIVSLLEKLPEEVYPVEIEGLGKPVDHPAIYSLERKVRVGKALSVSFRIANKGNHRVEVESGRQEQASGWVRMIPDSIAIPAKEWREARIEISARNVFLFMLRNGFRYSVRKQTELSLSLRIPEEEPYDLIMNIRVAARFLNPIPTAVLLALFAVGWAVITNVRALFFPGAAYKQEPRLADFGPDGSLSPEKQEKIKSVILPPPEELVPLVIADLEEGRFAEAGKRFQDIRRLYPEEERVRHLAEQMQKPLIVTSDLITSDGNGRRSGSMVRIPSGGGFRIRFDAAEPCYLYVYQIDSHDNVALLFPGSGPFPERNQLTAGTTQQLPAGDNWYILDENTGRETVYLVASRWRARDLEGLNAELNQEHVPDRKRALRKRLIEQLTIRKETCIAGAAGCVYREHAFLHR